MAKNVTDPFGTARSIYPVSEMTYTVLSGTFYYTTY